MDGRKNLLRRAEKELTNYFTGKNNTTMNFNDKLQIRILNKSTDKSITVALAAGGIQFDATATDRVIFETVDKSLSIRHALDYLERPPRYIRAITLRTNNKALYDDGMGFYGELPESHNLVVNINHSLIEQVLKNDDAEKQKQLVHQLTDLALLSNGLLKGEALTEFLKRSVAMIG